MACAFDAPGAPVSRTAMRDDENLTLVTRVSTLLCVVRSTLFTPHLSPAITMLKAHLANIRSTSGLPRLDPFSLYVEGIGKRRGE